MLAGGSGTLVGAGSGTLVGVGDTDVSPTRHNRQ